MGKFGPCLVRHGFCPFPSGVLYWPAQPLTPCPFERVGRYPFKEHRGKIISTEPVNRSNDSLVGHLLFTLKSDQFVCTDLPVLETQQGLFVTRDVRANNLSQTTASEKILDKLILAESDYEDEKLHDDVLRNNEEFSRRICESKMTHVRHGNHPDESFSRVHDLNGEALIIYHKFGNVYVPFCQPVDQIQPLTNLTKCYGDLSVFAINKFTAFLNPTGILRTNSREVSCERSNQEVNIDDRVLIQFASYLIGFSFQ